MSLRCKECKSEIDPKEINVQANLARCAGCGAVMRASELIEDEDVQETEFSWDPPAGSPVIVERKLGGDVAISYPAPGTKAFSWFGFGFTLFWLGFIAVWTTMAVVMSSGDGFPWFALGSIPFWIVGFIMLAGQVNAMTREEIVLLSDREVSVIRKSRLQNKLKLIPYASITSIDFDNEFRQQTAFDLDTFSRTRNMSKKLELQRFPKIRHENGMQPFFVNATPEEKIWVYRVVKTIILNKKDQILP